MNSALDFVKWLLEVDIRVRNALSVLLALLSIIVFHFTSKRTEWFEGLRVYGGLGVPIALLVIALVVFLVTWLICCGADTIWRRKRVLQRVEQEKRAVRSNLETLTGWQGQFLLRFLVEGRAQIPEWEIGGYKAVWGSEVEVLITKGMLKAHRHAGVYEIEPIYRDYLKQHWNPEAGTLA